MKQMVQQWIKWKKQGLNLIIVEKRDRLDAKIPKKKKQRLYENQRDVGSNIANKTTDNGKLNTADAKLRFSKHYNAKLRVEALDPKPSAKLLDKPKPYNHVAKAPIKAVKSKIHQEISKDGDDNIGVQSAHSTEKSLEFVGARAKSA